MQKDLIDQLVIDFNCKYDSIESLNINIENHRFKLKGDEYCVVANPILGLEIWQTPDSILVRSKDFCINRKQDSSEIYFNSKLKATSDIGYGVIRGEVTRLIRARKLHDAYFYLHAAFVRLDQKNYLIIGNKGTGKTCATLHFLSKGASVFTDETVIWTSDKIDFIQRSPALDTVTLNTYFSQLSNLVWRKQKSILNIQKKNLLKIKLESQLKDYQISKVFVLTRGNICLNKMQMLKLVAKQFGTGELSVNSTAIAALENLLKCVEVTNIKEIEEGKFDD
ncbi:hypothetical protein [Lactobacillus sp. M0396]|uniref:hypothetical protein n=1 Tax=Lactobacillus sp. M0396 TaxID=2751030 RepID=UPI0018DC0400|nr:hypothetical protein [Lactobacillus sp. M0396]MBI0033967.1 hypothetical protein [Lactobacillus sp. M0396]